jgi:hypothetical protein
MEYPKYEETGSDDGLNYDEVSEMRREKILQKHQQDLQWLINGGSLDAVKPRQGYTVDGSREIAKSIIDDIINAVMKQCPETDRGHGALGQPRENASSIVDAIIDDVTKQCPETGRVELDAKEAGPWLIDKESLMDVESMMEFEMVETDQPVNFEMVEADQPVDLKIEAQVQKIGKGRFSCSECGHLSTKSFNIKQHIAYKHKPESSRPFLCGGCDQKFVERRGLERHMPTCLGWGVTRPGRPVGSCTTPKPKLVHKTKTRIDRKSTIHARSLGNWLVPHSRQLLDKDWKLSTQSTVVIDKINPSNIPPGILVDWTVPELHPNCPDSPGSMEVEEGWRWFKRFCSVHDLAAMGIIETFVGPLCKSGPVLHPFW